MRRVLIAISFLAGMAAVSRADTFTRNAYAYEQLATTSGVQTLTTTYTSGVGYSGSAQQPDVFLTLETNSIRWRIDGGNPSSTVGHLMAAGDKIVIAGIDNIRNFRFTYVTAAGTLNATYER